MSALWFIFDTVEIWPTSSKVGVDIKWLDLWLVSRAIRFLGTQSIFHCFCRFTSCCVWRARMKWIVYHLICPWWNRWGTAYTCKSNPSGPMKPFMMISRRWRLVKTKHHVFLRCKHANFLYDPQRISCITSWENSFQDPVSFLNLYQRCVTRQ